LLITYGRPSSSRAIESTPNSLSQQSSRRSEFGVGNHFHFAVSPERLIQVPELVVVVQPDSDHEQVLPLDDQTSSVLALSAARVLA